MLRLLSPFAVSLWLLIIAAQIALSILLIYRKAHKKFPAFCGYVYFCTLTSLGLLPIAIFAEPAVYRMLYFPVGFLAELLSLLVAWEVYRIVYGPARSLPEFVPIRASQLVFGGFVSSVVLGSVLRANRGVAFTRAMMTTEHILCLIATATFLILVIYAHRLAFWWESKIAAITFGFCLMLIINTTAAFLRGRAPIEIAQMTLLAGPLFYLFSLILWFRCHLKPDTVIEKATKEQIDFALQRLVEAGRLMITK